MTAPTFALAIPSAAAWVPERQASLARLLERLGIVGHDEQTQRDEHGEVIDDCSARNALEDGYCSRSDHPVRFRIFGEKEPNHVWARKVYEWAASTNADFLLILEDDAIPCDDFWPILAAMVEARPTDPIGLEVVHDAAPALAHAGHRWITTNDCWIGVGNVTPMPVVRDYLAWLDCALVEDAFTLDARGVPMLTQDTAFALFGLSSGRRIYHPLPTVIDHDTALGSTYGNDAHGHRRPPVRVVDGWKRDAETHGHLRLDDPLYWRNGEEAAREPVHVGLFYPHATRIAARFLRSWTPDDERRIATEHTEGLRTIRRLALQIRMDRLDDPARPRLYVCTPTVGRPAAAEQKSTLVRLAALEHLDVVFGFELSEWTQQIDDLVTTRSRMVRDFLSTDCTHLLFVDDDQSFAPQTILGMLATGHDCVVAPYPKREEPNWPNVMRDDGRPPEARAYRYPIKWIPGEKRMQGDCVEVESAGLGCALLSRAMLEAMTVAYSLCATATPIEAIRLWATAVAAGHPEPFAGGDLARIALLACSEIEAYRDGRENLVVEDLTPSARKGPMTELFRLHTKTITVGDERLSVHMGEDASFFDRWRRIGGHVWLYLGPGSPIDHHGPMRFRGRLEAFGVSRKP